MLDWFDEITLVLVLLKKKKKKAECVVRFAEPINDESHTVGKKYS